jgi:signal transduction histidine kinase
VSIRDESAVVVADPDRLVAALEHAIRNAQDATPADGSVSVTVSADGDDCVIAVTDTGCGMTQEFVNERLFKPFDTTKGSQGMGIGAYQLREYVRSLGGSVEVKSATGRGTTFFVRLKSRSA